MENLILIDKEYIIYEASNIIKNIIPIMLNELNLEFSPYIFIENILNDNVGYEILALYRYKMCFETELLDCTKTGYERKPFLLSEMQDTITLDLNFIINLFMNHDIYFIKKHISFLLSHEMRHFWQMENNIFINELYNDGILEADQKTYSELRCESDANNFAYYFIRKYAIEIINI